MGCERSRLPHFLDNWLIDGTEVVSLKLRRLFTHRKIPGTQFCLKLRRPQGHSAVGWFMSTEKSYNIGNRTRDLPTCSIVLQPTTLPCAPIWVFLQVINFRTHNYKDKLKQGNIHGIFFRLLEYLSRYGDGVKNKKKNRGSNLNRDNSFLSFLRRPDQLRTHPASYTQHHGLFTWS
jgi:hypothetical protein